MIGVYHIFRIIVLRSIVSHFFFIPPSPLYVSVRFGFLARFPESLIFELSVVNAVKVSSFSFFSGAVMEVDGVGWSSRDGLSGTEVLFHFS